MTVEKRYQIFISSTFKDLIEERQEVLRAVLELNHMPAGMELFPAGDETAWQLIKDVIDASDYYVLIIGGRYGSLDAEGIGYTEKEYDYAVASKKPVIALLHKDPEKMSRNKTETEPETWEKLKKFRAKIENGHHCNYWGSAEELKAKVIVGLTSETKRRPQIGWVRANQIPSETTLADVLALRQRVSGLERQLESVRTEPPVGTTELAQGEDQFDINIDYTVGVYGDFGDDEEWEGSVSPTWNRMFAALAPSMINEASSDELQKKFRLFLLDVANEECANGAGMEGKEVKSVRLPEHEFNTVIVQLRALGLIRASERRRSLKDTDSYWALTPYGDRLMVQLRALRHGERVDNNLKELEQRIEPADAPVEEPTSDKS